MPDKENNIISLAGLRKDDLSVDDIRAFFDQLPELLGAADDSRRRTAALTGETRDGGDPEAAVRGALDDLTLVFRRALELSAGRRDLAADTDVDGLAESLTIIFHNVVSISRRGGRAEEIRRYLDIALGVLD